MRILAKNFLYKSPPNEWIVKKISDDDWQGVVYAKGKYIAVGYGGKIAYSSDGVEWTVGRTSPPVDWLSLTHSDFYDNEYNYVIASGEQNYIGTTNDGVNFNTYSISNRELYPYLKSIDDYYAVFVAVGWDGYYTFSKDSGVTFSSLKQISTNSSYKKTLMSVAASGTGWATGDYARIVAVGEDGIVASATVNSSSTISWKTPYMYSSGETEFQFTGVYIPKVSPSAGQIALTDTYLIDNYGYFYYSDTVRNLGNSDYTPILDNVEKTRISTDSSLMCMKVRNYKIQSSTYKSATFFFGDANGRLYKKELINNVIQSETSVEQIFPVVGTGVLSASAIRDIAFHGKEIVLVGENGYVAYKQSI